MDLETAQTIIQGGILVTTIVIAVRTGEGGSGRRQTDQSTSDPDQPDTPSES